MRDTDELFENEVRRVARALWPSAQYSGATKIEGRERDGVFETEECVHLVEATTSRKLEKAKQDIGKLVSLPEVAGFEVFLSGRFWVFADIAHPIGERKGDLVTAFEPIPRPALRSTAKMKFPILQRRVAG